MEQKGKAKRKKLADFIKEKIAEILSFSDSLSAKKVRQKKETFATEDVTKSQLAALLQPSPALVDELHKSINIGQEARDAVTG